MAKITYEGRDITGRYNRLSASKRFARRFLYHLKRLLRVGALLALVAWLMLGSLRFGISYADGTEMAYIAPVALADTTAPDYPILDKIALAESDDSQFCTKALVAKGMCPANQIGAVLIHVNTNGSYDLGKFQINSTHIADAIAQGYDVYTLEGNTAYAEYLFVTQGSEPWYSSKAGWGK